MFKFSSRLGCRFASVCVCAFLVFSIETFFCTDSAFAVGRRGRVRASQTYSYYSDQANYWEPVEVSDNAAIPVKSEKTVQNSEISDSQNTRPAAKTVSASPQKNTEAKKQSTPKPASPELALRANSLTTPPVAPAPAQLPEILCYWFTDINEASQAAASLKRPMLIHFYMESCGPCNWMEQKVLNQERIQKLAGSYYVMVKLDGNQNQELCSRLGILSFPADVIVSSEGKYITHSTGRQEVAQYSDFLTAAANQVNLPPMKKPVDSNWQKKLQLAQAPSHPKYPDTEMSAALEVPALDPPTMKDSRKENNQTVEEQDLFALSTPETPAAKTEEESLPVAEELDLMALSARQDIPREDASESEIDHLLTPPETPVLVAGETANPRLNINPTSFSQETKPVLEGFSPVTLVEENRWVRGDENISAEFEEALYYFASEGEKEQFLQNPRYYALVSSGQDVVALAESNQKVEGNRRFGVRFDDRNFVFSTAENLQKFRSNPEFYATKVREIASKSLKSESVR